MNVISRIYFVFLVSSSVQFIEILIQRGGAYPAEPLNDSFIYPSSRLRILRTPRMGMLGVPCSPTTNHTHRTGVGRLISPRGRPSGGDLRVIYLGFPYQSTFSLLWKHGQRGRGIIVDFVVIVYIPQSVMRRVYEVIDSRVTTKDASKLYARPT